MSTGIYRAASAMEASARRLDAVANNLANVSTPAFKRRTTSFETAPAGKSSSGERNVMGRVATDFSQGGLLATGRDLDLALEGRGFFAVDKPDGEAFTRDGSFRLDEGGVLVTAAGHPVAWDRLSGGFDPLGEPIVVDFEGNVSQGAQQVGRLKLADFDAERELVLDAEGDWRRPATVGVRAHEARVHQGHLEGSNVSAVEELIALVQIQRTYESAANALSAIEQSYRRLHRTG